MTDKEYISILESENVRLSQQIKKLEEKVLYLLSVQRKPSIKKDSHNSSLPPSSDIVSKKKSLRPKSELKSGGQPGHKGTTLEMSSTPDKINDLKSNYCNICGTDLSGAKHELQSKRQVVEIPPIEPFFEEYRQYSCECPSCNHKQVADFPAGVNAPIQYGSSVEALVIYLSVYQYVPFARLSNMFSQVFSLPLSQGTIGNILERSAKKCEIVYNRIKTEIAKSTVAGSDETGAKVNGKKWWIWAWQNIQNTFIVASDNRGSKTIDNIWENGLPNATLVSDRWAAQLKVNAKEHQLCLAHLLRDCIFLDESEKHPFASLFKQLLTDIFDIRKILKQAYHPDSQEAIDLEKRLNDLLVICVDKEIYPNTATFQNSMLKYRNYLLPCLYNLDIPPDNNGSERAIRNIKVKQKISGQFKSGQQAFCVIRSVIDTLIKREIEILSQLWHICRLQPV